MLRAGYPLSAVTEALCKRWAPGARLLPASDDRSETHVVVTDPDTDERRAIHFQEWWVRYRTKVPTTGFVQVGAEQAAPSAEVLAALKEADVVLVAPSNPVVSIGTVLAVPGIREAIAEAGVPVVGLSPIVGGAPVRGMADKMLSAIGVETTAAAVAEHYGSGLLDGWLVDSADTGAVAEVEAAGIRCRAVPLMMTDLDATAAMAREALALAEEVRA